MPDPQSPIRQTDDQARTLARQLIREARFGALAVLDPGTGAPFISRIALGPGPDGGLWSLISGLAFHFRALAQDPRAALLLGEPGPKGNPLTHPRLSLTLRARFLVPDDPAQGAVRARWLADHPKSKLYIDLPDFRFISFTLIAGALNGGFARAYQLTPDDMADL